MTPEKITRQEWAEIGLSKAKSAYGSELAQATMGRLNATLSKLEKSGDVDSIREIAVDRLTETLVISFKYAQGPQLNPGTTSSRYPMTVKIKSQ